MNPLRWKLPAANDSSGPAPAAQRPDALINSLQWLLNEIAAEATAAMRGRPPGPARLWAGIEGHLDARLRRPAARVLADALHGNETARRLQRRWRDGCILLMQIELQSLRATLAAANARLLGAMIEETAFAEHERRQALAEYRNGLQRQLWALQA